MSRMNRFRHVFPITSDLLFRHRKPCEKKKRAKGAKGAKRQGTTSEYRKPESFITPNENGDNARAAGACPSGSGKRCKKGQKSGKTGVSSQGVKHVFETMRSRLPCRIFQRRYTGDHQVQKDDKEVGVHIA